MKYEIALKKLYDMIDQCREEMETPITQRVVNQVLHRKRTNKEFKFSAQIGEYDVDNFILDLESDLNVFPKHTWEMMRKPKIEWSHV
jgi:hypothetical protein